MSTRLVTLVSILFINNTAIAAAHTLLPVYVERDLGLSPVFTGALIAIETAMGGCIAVGAGAMADRIGHRLVLVIGILGFSAGLLKFLTGIPWVLILLAIILGLAHGMRSTAAQSYLLSVTSRRSVGISTAAFFLGGTIGTAVSSAIAGPIIEAYGFDMYAYGGLALNLIPAALTLRYLQNIRPTRQSSSNGGLRTRDILRRRDVLLMGGLRFFPTAFFGVWSLTLPLLIFRATDSVLTTALYTAVGMGLSAVSQFIVGRWSDRCGRSQPIYTVLTILIMASAVAAFTWTSIEILMVVGIIGIIGAWNMSVLVLGTVRDRTAPFERNRIVGFVHALWSFGLLSGSLVAGASLDIHPTIPLLLATAANAAALLIAIRLFAAHPAPPLLPLERMG